MSISSSNPPALGPSLSTIFGYVREEPDPLKACQTIQMLLISISQRNFTEHELSEMYDQVIEFLPRLSEELLDSILSDLSNLLTATPCFYEKQLELAMALARWRANVLPALRGELSSLNRLGDCYLPALHYYGKALQIAASHAIDPANIHCEASAALIKFFIRSSSHFIDRLEQAKGQGNPAAFKAILDEIFHFYSYVQSKEDLQTIRELFHQARTIFLTIKPASKERFAHLYADIEQGVFHSTPSSFASPATARYREAFSAFRTTFTHPLKAKERFERFQQFFQEVLLRDALIFLGPPPCQYDLRAMGSLGRKEMCPYSDLEWFILVADDSEETKQYFTTLARFIEMQVTSLGETAAAGLLVFTALGEMHTSGFHIDSGGNPAIRELSLIGTPQTLAALQIPITRYELESPAQTLLTSSSLASTDATLFDQYQEALSAILDQPTKEGELQTKRHDRGYHLLQERNRRCLESWPRPFLGQPVNLKTNYVELINHLLNSLALYHGIIPDHSAEMIDQLAARGSFAEETTLLLKECVEMIYQMRVRLHLHHRQQQDQVEIHPTHPNAFPLTNQEKEALSRYYWLLIKPLYFHLTKGATPPFQHFSITESLAELVVQSQEHPLDRTEIESLTHELATHLCRSGASLALHAKFYQALSIHPAYESARTLYIDQLISFELQEIVNDLSIIPNRDGMRQSTRLSEIRFQEQLRSLVQPLPTAPELVCKVTSPTLSGTHYLTPAVLSIFEEKKTFLLFSAGMGLRKVYQTSAHSVFRYQQAGVDLHFKQKPCHPLMEYAIYNLISRIIGVGAPVTELARFELSVNGRPQSPYPVLISETIPGATIDALLTPPHFNVRVSPAHFTWMCLVSLLTRPGDGRAANYVVTPQGLIYCVDNDISLVEPIVRDTSGREVKFCSILFCLKELLDPNVLNQFCELDIASILSSWIDDVTEKEKQYCAFFSPVERQRLYDEDKDNLFTPTLLFRPGELGALYAQFHHLKQFIKEVRPTTPLDLLSSLLTLRGEEQVTNLVGPRIRTAYELGIRDHPKEQLAQALSRSMRQSLTSPEAMKVSLGRTPTVQEIENNTFSIHQAREELITYTLLHNESIEGAKKGTIEVNFAPWNHDFKQELEKLNFILHYISRQSTKPTALVLTNSSVLTEQLLAPILHEEITLLNLSGCTKLSSVNAIVARCPYLEKLYLSGCTSLKTFGENQGLFRSSVEVELLYLRELHFARCPNLQNIVLKSHALKDLKANNNPRLTSLDLNVPVLPTILIADCPKLDPVWEGRMNSAIASHTNPWRISKEDLHQLYDTSVKELSLFSEVHLGDIQDTIKRKRSLKQLRVQLLEHPESVMPFAQTMIQMNLPFQVFDLRLNSLGDSHLEVLAHSLEQNNTLLRLCLDRNRITNRGAQALLAALQTNTTLLALDLGSPEGSNEVSQEIRQEINACLERNRQLKPSSSSSSSSAASSSSGDLERTEQQLRLLAEQIDVLERSQYSLKEEEVSRLVEQLNQINPNLTQLRGLQERAEALYSRCTSSSSSTFRRAQILQRPFTLPPVSLEFLNPLPRYPEFGAEEWLRYFGDVGVEPPLSPNIEEILASPCPFWPEKRVSETHLLVLIPATVNGRPFKLDYLGDLIQAPKNGGYATKCSYYWRSSKQQEGSKSVKESYWVLMTRDVVPGTRSYTGQRRILEEKTRGNRLLSSGEVPTLLEAATSILLEYVRTGRRLYSNHPLTYTPCQEVLNGFQTFAGGFSAVGLYLYDSYYDYSAHQHSGFACCRKFLGH